MHRCSVCGRDLWRRQLDEAYSDKAEQMAAGPRSDTRWRPDNVLTPPLQGRVLGAESQTSLSNKQLDFLSSVDSASDRRI